MTETDLHIDRDAARAAFGRYVAAYDASNPSVALKVAHTLRVAALCDRIARASGFTDAGCDLAWLCGLLHDLGRFEQLRRWGTFRDAQSARHASLGAAILFGTSYLDDPACACRPVSDPAVLADDERFFAHARAAGSIRSFVASPAMDGTIRAAVAHHSAYRLPAELDTRTRLICETVRDADKIDIMRVACTETPEATLGVSAEELLASTVSPAVEDAFYEHRTVRHDERETPADYLVGLACFAYELALPASLEIADDEGYLFLPLERPFGLERPFTEPATRFALNRMDGHLRAWVDERLG